MTTRDFCIKWGVYVLALLPVWFCEAYVLGQLPLTWVRPTLLPLAAICVAVLEGGTAGAGFGLGVGVLWDAIYPGGDGAMTVTMCVLGMAAGVLAQHLLRQDLVGCLLCALLGLVLLDGWRILFRLLQGESGLSAMLSVAGREIGISLLFVFPVYALFLWVYHRVPKKTVL